MPGIHPDSPVGAGAPEGSRGDGRDRVGYLAGHRAHLDRVPGVAALAGPDSRCRHDCRQRRGLARPGSYRVAIDTEQRRLRAQAELPARTDDELGLLINLCGVLLTYFDASSARTWQTCFREARW